MLERERGTVIHVTLIDALQPFPVEMDRVLRQPGREWL
jgi:hypothetical protein